MKFGKSICVTLAAAMLGACTAGEPEQRVTVAVAANFLAPLEVLAAEFERETATRVVVTAGSTGQLYAQIVNGAPFDLLLAADAERPRLLVDEGLGDPASVFTYAVGRLAIWSRDPARVDDNTLMTLGVLEYRFLAIAEPAVAPYGRAAQQVLERLGVEATLEGRIVRGQSIAQTFAMVETGGAELGLVALSQVLTYSGPGSYRLVPESLHEPIRQDAVLLDRAVRNPAARNFLEYLRSDKAAAILRSFGYREATTP